MRSLAILVLAMLLSLSSATAQHAVARHDSLPQKPMRQRSGIWYTPVLRNTTVNGVAAGVYTSAAWRRDSLTVNGLNIEADPVPVVGIVPLSMLMLMYLPRILETKHQHKISDTGIVHIQRQRRHDSLAQYSKHRWDTVAHTTINGLSISTGILKSKTKVNGSAINVIFAIQNEMNGVELSGLFNVHKSFRGLIMALVNVSGKGKGVQIGIVNHSKEGKLVQIGLVNTIGHRTTPIINFSHKIKER